MKKKFFKVVALGLCVVTAFNSNSIISSAAQDEKTAIIGTADESFGDCLNATTEFEDDWSEFEFDESAVLDEELDYEDIDEIVEIASVGDADGVISDDGELVDATRKTGLYKVNGVYRYYKDGKWIKDKYGFVNYDDSKFLVAHGVVATKQSGLTQDPNHAGVWYYLAGGRVQTQYSGFCSYNKAWFLVKAGKLVNDATGFYKYDGGLFFLQGGRLLKTASGLIQDPNTKKWYYCANGQAQTSYTGLALYDGKWFYIQKGYFDASYTGYIEWKGRVYLIKNGTMVKDCGVGTIYEKESNNTKAKANRVSLGIPKFGIYGTRDDIEDWYAVDLQAGHDYTIEFEDWLGSFKNTTALIDLIMPDGREISLCYDGFQEYNDNVVTLMSRQTGTYYIRLYNFTSSKTGVPYALYIDLEK